jgi:hypothetical protein
MGFFCQSGAIALAAPTVVPPRRAPLCGAASALALLHLGAVSFAPDLLLLDLSSFCLSLCRPYALLYIDARSVERKKSFEIGEIVLLSSI